MYQSLVKKFQEGAEGSIEKKISEIDFIFFARNADQVLRCKSTCTLSKFFLSNHMDY